MTFDALVRLVEYRCKQSLEILGAQEHDVLELTKLARGLAAQNAVLARELRLREGVAGAGEPVAQETVVWADSDERKAELLNTAAWQAKYVAQVRETERAALQAVSWKRDNLWAIRRTLDLLAWVEELVDAENCGECDEDGWNRWRCGEDTCENEAPCDKCNREGLRTSLRYYWDEQYCELVEGK